MEAAYTMQSIITNRISLYHAPINDIQMYSGKFVTNPLEQTSVIRTPSQSQGGRGLHK